MTRHATRIERMSPGEARTAAETIGIPEYMTDLSVFQVLLHHPRVARAINGLLSTLLWDGELDERLRELAIMRIAWLTGSDYEWTQHWRVATALGVSASDLVAVRDRQGHDQFGPGEQAVLAATDETVLFGRISDDTWSLCVEHVGDHRVLIELVTVIGTWQMIATLLHSLQVPLEDGIDSWPPDGVPPPGPKR